MSEKFARRTLKDKKKSMVIASDWESEGPGSNPGGSRQPLTPDCQKITSDSQPKTVFLERIKICKAHFKICEYTGSSWQIDLA